VLDLVSDLAKKGRVLKVELSGPTLEDVFMDLLGVSGPEPVSGEETA